MKELAQVPIFRKVEAGELERLSRIARRETFKANTIVFFQGDRADKLFVILSGGAEVSQKTADGRRKVIGRLGAGEIFGELTLLDGRERCATVETVEATEMLSIAQPDFQAFAAKNPDILWRVIDVLCERIRGLNEETLRLAFEEVPYRVLRALDEIIDKQGKPEGRIVIKTTAAEIGSRVGVDRGESHHVLKTLNQRGLIELELDQIVIPDVRAFKRALEYAREWF